MQIILTIIKDIGYALFFVLMLAIIYVLLVRSSMSKKEVDEYLKKRDELKTLDAGDPRAKEIREYLASVDREVSERLGWGKKEKKK